MHIARSWIGKLVLAGALLSVLGAACGGGKPQTAPPATRLPSIKVSTPAISIPPFTPPSIPVSLPVSISTGSTGPCARLVTIDQISAAVGETVTGPRVATSSVSGIAVNVCVYTGSTGGPAVNIELGTAPGSLLQVGFQQVKQQQSGQDVPGLGDAAFYSSETDSIAVIKGDKFLGISFEGGPNFGDPAKEKPAELQLAQIAVNNL